MYQIHLDDLEDLAIGASILGSGGGGDPTYDLLQTQVMIERHGPVTIISAEELQPEDLVVPVAIMGAPLISIEKIVGGNEIQQLIHLIEQQKGFRKVTALMPGEIGGGNAFTPLSAAAKLGLPVLDADTIGRAFPQLQMSSCNLYGINPSPAFVCDSLGNSVTVHANDANSLEQLLRHIVVAMGSSASIALYLMTGKQAQSCTVHGTITQALQLGRQVRRAVETHQDVANAIFEVTTGKKIATGTLIDIDQNIQNGFLSGSASLQTEDGIITILYQNEYLMATQQGKTVAMTPDIITLLEQGTGRPITSERLRYGMRVDLITLEAPPLWKTPEGLSLVGPQIFGYQRSTP